MNTKSSIGNYSLTTCGKILYLSEIIEENVIDFWPSSAGIIMQKRDGFYHRYISFRSMIVRATKMCDVPADNMIVGQSIYIHKNSHHFFDNCDVTDLLIEKYNKHGRILSSKLEIERIVFGYDCAMFYATNIAKWVYVYFGDIEYCCFVDLPRDRVIKKIFTNNTKCFITIGKNVYFFTFSSSFAPVHIWPGFALYRAIQVITKLPKYTHLYGGKYSEDERKIARKVGDYITLAESQMFARLSQLLSKINEMSANADVIFEFSNNDIF